MPLRKEEPIPKTNLGPDRGLQLTLVKPKSLVVAGHQVQLFQQLSLASFGTKAVEQKHEKLYVESSGE